MSKSPGAASPSSDPALRRTRFLIVLGCAVVVAGMVGVAWYLQVRRRLPLRVVVFGAEVGGAT